ncbi:MAG: LysR family transcriptional regulator [Pseudomonadota bacterium]|nr:LysR family transcriptional regulator [Pseudomonadota bacterium]
MNINSVDLNLMIAFRSLIIHRHVTKAGLAIGRSQPAMSYALSRLRGVFNDQLLVKSGNMMKPTPRALELLPQISQALNQLENTLVDDIKFEPSNAKTSFTIAMVESAAFALLPKLSPFLFKSAPKIDLNIIGVTNIQGVELIKTERCEMAIEIPPKILAPQLNASLLYREEFMCMARSNHSFFSNRTTLKNYLKYNHIAVHPSEGVESSVDNALRSMGKHRRVSVRLPYSLLVNLMLTGSDLIATLPKRNALFFSDNNELRTLPVPFDIPNFHIHLIWDSRFEKDPAHKWMRSTIQKISYSI